MITTLKIDDANRVAELMSYADFLRPDEVEIVVNDFCAMGADERWLGYQINGRLSGLAYIASSDQSNTGWAIKFIYVKPDMRGLGISKALTKYAEMELSKWSKSDLAVISSGADTERMELFGRWGCIYL